MRAHGTSLRCKSEMRRCRRSCGENAGTPAAMHARDRGPQTVRRDSQEDEGRADAVVSRKQVENGPEERLGYGDPACAAGLRDRLRDTPAHAGLVDVAPCELLELSDSHSGRVEYEHR